MALEVKEYLESPLQIMDPAAPIQIEDIEIENVQGMTFNISEHSKHEVEFDQIPLLHSDSFSKQPLEIQPIETQIPFPLVVSGVTLSVRDLVTPS